MGGGKRSRCRMSGKVKEITLVFAKLHSFGLTCPRKVSHSRLEIKPQKGQRCGYRLQLPLLGVGAVFVAGGRLKEFICSIFRWSGL